MRRGTITRMVTNKGFGFIRDDDDLKDVFFHMSACRDFTAFSALKEGQIVTFTTAPSVKGPRAENVNAATE